MFASVPWIAGRQNSIYIVLISFHFLFYDCIYSWLGKEVGTSWWNLYRVGCHKQRVVGMQLLQLGLRIWTLASWILGFTRGVDDWKGAWRNSMSCWKRNTQEPKALVFYEKYTTQVDARLLFSTCIIPCLLSHCSEVGRVWKALSPFDLFWLILSSWEFLSPIKISWAPERLIINTKYTSLNSTEIHSFQWCLSSCFLYSWQLGWVRSCQECFFLGTKHCHSTSPAPPGEWGLLCLLLRG